MRVKLAYGREGLWVDLPDHNVTVVEPRFVEGVPDEAAAIVRALRQPLGSPPLRELVKPEDTVAIVFSVSYPDEKVIHGTLGTILDVLGEEKLPHLYLFYVGDALKQGACCR